MLAFVVMLSTFTVHAGTVVSIGDYQKYKQTKGDNWKSLLVYIMGAGEALDWANAYLSVNNRAPLFCVPERLRLNAATLVSIIDDELADEKKGKNIHEPLKDSDNLEPVLLYGLIHTFPCKQAEPSK